MFFFAGGNVSTQEKLIVLTFDDGPRPKILLGGYGNAGLIEVLDESFNVPAHFFMVRSKVVNNSALAKSISQKGFFVENHT